MAYAARDQEMPVPPSPDGHRGAGTEGVILDARRLVKEFKGFVAVDDVSINVETGTIHALIGPNGAGKTTVFNLLTKFLAPTSGQIVYKGRDVTKLASAEIARMGIVRSFQISAVFSHLTVLQNVRVALQRHTGTAFAFWKPASSLKVLNARAEDLLRSVGLKGTCRLRA